VECLDVDVGEHTRLPRHELTPEITEQRRQHPAGRTIAVRGSEARRRTAARW
jgi:hypothetical protein